MSFSNSQLAQKLSDLIDYWSNFSVEHKNWLGGVVGGGPNSDGEYPLTDYSGNEILVKSPAQLQDDVDNITTGATAQANAAAASAAAALTSENNAATSESNALSHANDADADRVAAALSETNATNAAVTSTTQANLANDRAGYAQEWANAPFETLVSSAAGGDQVDDYSALHWATVAAGFAGNIDSNLYGQLAQNETVTGNWVFDGTVTFNGNIIDNGDIIVEDVDGNGLVQWNNETSGHGLQVRAIGGYIGLIPYVSGTGLDYTRELKFNPSNLKWTIEGPVIIDGVELNAANQQAWTKRGVAEAVTGVWNFSNGLQAGGASIDATLVGQWNTAYGWGDHGAAGYAKLGTLTQTDTYALINRTSTNPAMYVVQANSTNDPVMRVGAGTIGSTTFSDALDIYGGSLRKTDDYLDIACGPSSYTALRMASPQSIGTIYGYFYADANGIGILHDAGGWAVQVRDTTHEIDLHENVYVASGKGLSVDGVWTRQLTYLQSGYEWFNYTSASVTVNNWYTIATDPATLNITSDPTGLAGASRASARIKIWDIDSGQHGFIEFEVSCNYHRRPRITILNSSGYGGDANVINAIRVLRYSTYNGVAIQVRAGHTGNLRMALHTQHSGGFTLRGFEAQTPHANWKIDLFDFSSYGAMPHFAAMSGPTDGATGTSHMDGPVATRLGTGVGTASDQRFYPCGAYGGYFAPNNQQYGLLRLLGTAGGYTGICLDPQTGMRATAMNNGTTCGFYDDTNNKWLLNGIASGSATLYYSGTGMVQTMSTGARHPSYGAYYHNASSSYLGGKVTFSTSAASGGSSGDIWFQYT